MNGRALLAAALGLLAAPGFGAEAGLRTLKVLDGKGKPVPGALAACFAFTASGRLDAATVYLSTTDAKGEAAFPGAPASCVPAASKPGFHPTLVEQLADRAASGAPSLTLVPSTAAAGMVLLQVSGLKPGDTYVASLRSTPDPDSVDAVAFLIATAATAGIRLDNVPSAPAGSLLYSVAALGSEAALQGIVAGEVEAGTQVTELAGPVPEAPVDPDAWKKLWPAVPVFSPPAGVPETLEGNVADAVGALMPGATLAILLSTATDAPACATGTADARGHWSVWLPENSSCGGRKVRYPAEFAVSLLVDGTFSNAWLPRPGMGFGVAFSSAARRVDLQRYPAGAAFGVHKGWPVTVAGRVSDAVGKALESARVTVALSTAPGAPVCLSGLTDQDGRWSVYLPAGSVCEGSPVLYPAWFTVATTLPRLPRNLRVAESSRTASVAFSSAAAQADREPGTSAGPLVVVPVEGSSTPYTGNASLFGEVLDDRGRPVAAARVLVRSGPDLDSLLCGFSDTEASGRYAVSIPSERFCGDYAGPRRLYVDLQPPPEYAGSGPPAPVDLGTSTTTFRLDWGRGGARPGPTAGSASTRVCAAVSIDGRPLPSGFAHLIPDPRAWRGGDAMSGRPHPGPVERRFVRFSGGEFCVDGVRPGNYLLRISPGSAFQPLDLAYDGLTGDATGYRLSVDASEEVGVFDGDGKRRIKMGRKSLKLVYTPEAASSALEGRLLFPAGVEADLEREPVLLELGFGRGPYGGLRRSLTWVRGRSSGGGIPFSLTVPAEPIQEVALLSERWAVAGTDSSRPGRLDIRVARGSRLSGSVRMPDGKPFVPGVRRQDEVPQILVEMELTSMDDAYTARDFADEEGRFEFPAVAPGWWTLNPLGLGNLFTFSVPRPAWIYMDGSKKVDFQILPWAALRVDPDGIDPPASPRHWVMGVPAGTKMPERASLLFAQAVPIALVQNSSGAWARSLQANPWLVRVAPGAFDFYLVDRTEDPLPAVRLLRPAQALTLTEQSTTTLRMPGPYREGGGSLGGVIKASVRLRSEDRGLAPFDTHSRVVPRVNLFLGDTWVGAAFGAASPEIYRAMDTGDAAELQSRVAHRDWAFGISGLPAGHYRAVVSALGHPDREFAVTVEADSAARLDVDLDAAP